MRSNLAKYLATLAFCILGLLTSILLLNPAKAAAVTGSQWQANRIADDFVFYNPHSMSSQEIQNFLNAKVPVCDNDGSEPISPGSSTTRAQWAAANGKPLPPYTCLKDYALNVPGKSADSFCGAIGGGSKSAATMIKEVAAACNINPQTLIVLLQKEQSLVTDDWPWPRQYEAATGYACPDTAACNPEFAGLFNQLYYGARQYQRYAKQPELFNHRVSQTSFVQYNPNSGCGGTNITMQTQATAGLYNYTPYQPNQAALNNLYGTGDGCSAYGNRNFWRMFWDWFGSPIGPDYAWLIDSFSYSGGDNSIAQGQTETLTLKARNVGRTPWYNHSSCPVRLGAWPPGRSSSFANGTWLNSSRMSNMQESVVQPNEVGTFTFQITPNQEGSFVEAMNLVAENCLWMPWPGLSPTIQVTGPYQWRITDVIYDNGTGYMDPGKTQLITLKALNAGSVTWSKTSGPAIRLGTWQPGRPSQVANGWLSSTRAVTMNENTVAPGQVAGFQFYVKMPASGAFYERMNLVAEGLTWFNDPGLTLYLQGRTYSWEPLWHSHSTGTANIPRSTDFTLTLKVRNTGTTTWTKAGDFPTRLATVAPMDRGSALYHSSWIRDTRPAGLIETSVAPGQEGTFIFNARTPDAPGPRQERFSLVAEGVLWFNDPGFQIYVNVL